MSVKQGGGSMLRITASVLISVALGSAPAPAAAWRFDCGPADSPVAPGYRALTPGHRYSSKSGFGWET